MVKKLILMCSIIGSLSMPIIAGPNSRNAYDETITGLVYAIKKDLHLEGGRDVNIAAAVISALGALASIALPQGKYNNQNSLLIFILCSSAFCYNTWQAYAKNKALTHLDAIKTHVDHAIGSAHSVFVQR